MNRHRTKQERVLAALPGTKHWVSNHLDISLEQAANALTALRQKGLAEVAADPSPATWTARNRDPARRLPSIWRKTFMEGFPEGD